MFLNQNIHVCTSVDKCQKTKLKSLKNRPFDPRTPVVDSPMEFFPGGVNFISKDFETFKYLLVTTCKRMNFILAITIKTRAAQVVAEALVHIHF